MPDTAVDTNVLLDVLFDDPVHGAKSARALDRAAREGTLVIGPATVAELAVAFARGSRDMEAFLAEANLRATPLRPEDAIAAGQEFAAHLQKAKNGCPACGKPIACRSCHEPIRRRSRIAADFLVAGHARAAGRLLTRDKGIRMRGVKIVRP